MSEGLKTILLGIGAVGIVLLAAAFSEYDTNDTTEEESDSDDFNKGVTDALCNVGRRSYGPNYTAGYNVWCDDM